MADDASALAPATAVKTEQPTPPPTTDAPATATPTEGIEAAPTSQEAVKEPTDDGK